MIRKRLLLPMLCGALACSYVPEYGRFDNNGFQNRQFRFNVKGNSADLVGAGWAIDNYVPYDLTPKQGPAYTSDYQLDTDGNGSLDATVARATYDLRYKHEQGEGAIWLRSFPIGIELAGKDLSVLGKMLVDSIANDNLNLARFGGDNLSGTKAVRVEVTSEAPAKLGALEALALSLNVFDAAAAAEAKPKKRTKLVLLRLPQWYPVKDESPRTYPILMVLGYSNTPEAFDSQLKDFQGFADRVAIGEEQKLVISEPPPAEEVKEPEAEQPKEEPPPEPPSVTPDPADAGPDAQQTGEPPSAASTDGH
jgi:hypothetical protein